MPSAQSAWKMSGKCCANDQSLQLFYANRRKSYPHNDN